MGVSFRVTTAGGLAAVCLAVFTSSALALGAGDFDPTFSDDGYLVDPIGPPNSSNRRGATPYSVSVLPDGKVLLVSNASDNQNSVTRLNEDGTFDAGFGAGSGTVNTRFGAPNDGSLFPWTSAVQPDGKIVVGGYFYSTSSGQQHAWVARLNADGSRDESFATGGFFSTQLGDTFSGFRDLLVQPDGKILAVGGANSGGHAQTLLARFDQEGKLDPSFGSGGKTLKLLGTGMNANSGGESVALQPDGKIVIAGAATDDDPAQPDATVLARFDGDGKDLDPSFGNGGSFLGRLGKPKATFYMTPASMALQPDGKLVVVGTGIENSMTSGTDFHYVARVNADGQGMDLGFADGGVFRPTWSARGGFTDVAVQPDGKIVAVGSYNSSAFGGIGGLFARFTGVGQLDNSFAGTGYVVKQFAPPGTNTSDLSALAMDPRGKLVAVGGTLEKLNGNLDERAIVARLITDLPPAAAFTVSPASAQTGQAIAFDDAGSADPDGSVTDWSWSFGDGGTASGPHTTHAYAAPGTYTATLTVRDDYGQTATSSQAVTVNAVPAPPPGAATPVLTAFTIKPIAFPAATKGGSIAAARKPGAVVTYTDSLAATTTFTVARAMPGRKRGKSCVKPTRSNRKAKRCTRYVRVRGSFKHVDKAGKNSLRFTGRLRRKALKPGTYRLTATPKLGGKSGKAVSAAFRIVRKKK